MFCLTQCDRLNGISIMISSWRSVTRPRGSGIPGHLSLCTYRAEQSRTEKNRRHGCWASPNQSNRFFFGLETPPLRLTLREQRAMGLLGWGVLLVVLFEPDPDRRIWTIFREIEWFPCSEHVLKGRLHAGSWMFRVIRFLRTPPSPRGCD